MPEVVILEPTLACNLACPMCDRSLELRKRAAAPLPPTEYLAAVRPLLGPGKDFYISGGEPTVWPGLPWLCEAILAAGGKVVLQTNGTRPETVRQLLDVGVTQFNLSLDGPPPVHDGIRGAGSYRLLCETAAAISGAAGAHYVTTTVISECNQASVGRIFASCRRDRIRPSVMIFELARKFDREAVRRSAALARVDAQEVAVAVAVSREFAFSLAALEAVLQKLQDLARSYRRRIMFLPDRLPQRAGLFHGYLARNQGRVTCRHRGILRIDPQANVIPCFTFRTPLGNLRHDGWEDIARKSALFWDRLERNNLSPVCETCFRLTGT